MKQLRFFENMTSWVFDGLSTLWGMVPRRAIFVVLCESSDLDQQQLLEGMSRLIRKGYLCQVSSSKRLKNICLEKAKTLLLSGPPEWTMPQWIVLLDSSTSPHKGYCTFRSVREVFHSDPARLNPND